MPEAALVICCPRLSVPLLPGEPAAAPVDGLPSLGSDVRLVHRLLTLLYQTLGSIPNVLRPLPYFRRQRHTGKEMPAHTLGKIGSASWT